MSEYQPGICNIGGAEVARRKQVAILGSALFIAFAALAIIRSYSPQAALIGLIPAFIASIGYVQSRKRFCLAYGLLGTFNFAALGSISKVTDAQALAADRRTAAQIILQSLGLAIAVTGLLLTALALI